MLIPQALHSLARREYYPQLAIQEATATGVMWAGFVLCMIFVALRTHIQYQNAGRLFANDYFIFAALVLHLASCIQYQVALPHLWNLVLVGMKIKQPDANFMANSELFLKLQFSVDFTLWTTLWLVKFSLLFFFWRLFDSVQSHMKYLWWTMLAITGTSWVVIIILAFQACDPITNFFTLGTCNKPRDVFYSNLVFQFVSGTDIAGDILIMLIPFPLLRKLQVTQKQQYVLIAIFLLPIIPIIFAVLRFVKAMPTTGNVDPIQFQFWSMLENAVAIITACIPSIRLFVAKQKAQNASRYYANDGTDSGTRSNHINSKAQFSFRKPEKGSIPLDTLVDSRNGNIVEDDTAGILVKQDYHVESRQVR